MRDLDKWVRSREPYGDFLRRWGPLLPLVLGAVFLVLTNYSIAHRLLLSVQGEVVDAEKVCADPQRQARCSTTYSLRASETGESFQYRADSEGTLTLDLHPGDVIDKPRWQFAYRVNGHEVNDFHVAFLGILEAAIVISLAWWVRRLKRESNAPQK